ncbi:MAG: hypothetical protein NTV70_03460 [Acidobacteria bacterium]|nr:hypothetical protein [Acidobacteriota bacterium]
MDITFPGVPLTGAESGIEHFTTPDERNLRFGMTIQSLQAPYLALDVTLPSAVPKQLADRIAVSRRLGIQAYFCYEFHAVSMFWSITSIEMALKLKFQECNPGPFELAKGTRVCSVEAHNLERHLKRQWRIQGLPTFDGSFKSILKWAFDSGHLPDDLPIPLQEVRGQFDQFFLFEVLHGEGEKDGRLPANPTLEEITGYWESLSETERKRECFGRQPSSVLANGLPRLRNNLAHPRLANIIVTPRSAVTAYSLLVDIARRLWPASSQDSIEDSRQIHP